MEVRGLEPLSGTILKAENHGQQADFGGRVGAESLENKGIAPGGGGKSRTVGGHSESSTGLPKNTIKTQSEHNISTLDSELQELINAWGNLPGAIKIGMLAMVRNL